MIKGCRKDRITNTIEAITWGNVYLNMTMFDLRGKVSKI